VDLLEYKLSKYPIECECNSEQAEEDYEVEEKIEYFLRPDKKILKSSE
jgi:hypothetical protein